MTAGLLRLGGLAAAALAIFTLVAAVGAAALYPLAARRMARQPPRRRSRALVAWAVAPAASGAALVALSFLPSVAAALGLAVDHCPVHDHHLHLCYHHLPDHGPGVAVVATLGAAAAMAGAALLRGARAALLVRRLAAAPVVELAPGVDRIDSPRSFAVTVGWIRSRVLVSTGLLARLTPRQLEVVLAHERAHGSRRDALAATVARMLSCTHLPWVRRRILLDLALASEQACDEAAAEACGDPLLVAETILAVERAATASAPPHPALAFNGAPVARRVEALLAPEGGGAAEAPRTDLWIVAAVAAALAVGAAAPHVHHWTETLLAQLPH